MKCKDIQEIALVYGNKDLVLEFLEIFKIDRKHDGAPIKAILVKSDIKKDLKHLIWKGD